MVKRIKKRRSKGLDAKALALYDILEAAMRDERDLNTVFDAFMTLTEHTQIGRPSHDEHWVKLLAVAGRGGVGGVTYSGPPTVMAFESQHPAIVHGLALFPRGSLPFVYLPHLGRGIIARSEGPMMHYQRFTETVLSPGSNPVAGDSTMH